MPAGARGAGRLASGPGEHGAVPRGGPRAPPRRAAGCAPDAWAAGSGPGGVCAGGGFGFGFGFGGAGEAAAIAGAAWHFPCLSLLGAPSVASGKGPSTPLLSF